MASQPASQPTLTSRRLLFYTLYLISGVGVTWGMTIPALGYLLIVVPYILATRRQNSTLQLRGAESTIKDTSPVPSIGQE